MRHPLLQDQTKIYVTADSHFGQVDAIESYDRPFADETAMTDAIVDCWNDVLRPDDVLIHLGDFVGDIEDTEEKVRVAAEVRQRLRVERILLVRGNHDPRRAEFESIFDDVVDLLDHRAKHATHRVVMSHYPMRSWRGNRRGSVHLYGHTHGRLEEIGRSTDVGVDCWKFRPLRLDALLRSLEARPIVAFPMRRMRRQPQRDAL